MSPSLPGRPSRRLASPYPISTRPHRAVRSRFPDFSTLLARDSLSNEGPSFLGTQGQPIELDNPSVASEFRPLTSLPSSHDFNPLAVSSIPATHDQAGHEPSTPNRFARELASPVYRDSPPAYHQDDSPVFRPQSPLFRPSPPLLTATPEVTDQMPVSPVLFAELVVYPLLTSSLPGSENQPVFDAAFVDGHHSRLCSSRDSPTHRE